jgi:hypothetical protein
MQDTFPVILGTARKILTMQTDLYHSITYCSIFNCFKYLSTMFYHQNIIDSILINSIIGSKRKLIQKLNKNSSFN